MSCDWTIIGLDALTDYYDVNLKKDRQKLLSEYPKFYNYQGLVQDPKLLNKIQMNHKPNIIIHLAAQAGVRHSLKKPIDYVQNNLIAFFNLIECCKIFKILLARITSGLIPNIIAISFILIHYLISKF